MVEQFVDVRGNGRRGTFYVYAKRSMRIAPGVFADQP
jgi:hypothetical protein